ncbi:hypothetical protein Dimus_010731 [Dionaea muscipula]
MELRRSRLAMKLCPGCVTGSENREIEVRIEREKREHIPWSSSSMAEDDGSVPSLADDGDEASCLFSRGWSVGVDHHGDGGVRIALVIFVVGGDGGRASSSVVRSRLRRRQVEMEELESDVFGDELDLHRWRTTLESDVFGDELDLHRWRASCILGFLVVDNDSRRVF